MENATEAPEGYTGRLVPPGEGDDFNAVEEVIFRRRSVRTYQKKQVPEYLVRRIIEAGRFAPSAGNCQPWKFVVVQDPEMLADMTADVVRFCRRVAGKFDYIDGAPWRLHLARAFQRLRPNDLHPVPFGAVKLVAEGKLGLFHGAPTVILILADTRAAGTPALDVGISGQNMVLTAHSYGLGTCWVSFVQPLARMAKWRDKIGIKPPYKLFTSIAVGYPRGDPDGQVPRETKAIDWFAESGAFKVVY